MHITYYSTTMPKIQILPHPTVCPAGASIEVATGTTVLDAALSQGIFIEHACEKSCACTTCHVIVRAGYESLDEACEIEEDMLDKAWGLEGNSRLSCQCQIIHEDLIIEIPKYTLNQVSEKR